MEDLLIVKNLYEPIHTDMTHCLLVRIFTRTTSKTIWKIWSNKGHPHLKMIHLFLYLNPECTLFSLFTFSGALTHSVKALDISLNIDTTYVFDMFAYQCVAYNITD